MSEKKACLSDFKEGLSTQLSQFLELRAQLEQKYDRLDAQGQASSVVIFRQIFPRKVDGILIESFEQLDDLIDRTRKAVQFLLDHEEFQKS